MKKKKMKKKIKLLKQPVWKANKMKTSQAIIISSHCASTCQKRFVLYTLGLLLPIKIKIKTGMICL